MKKISHFKKTLFILGIGIAPFNGHVYAANEIANTIADNKEAQFESAEVTAIKLNELKGGALNYFSENDAWPLNVTDLATNGFYYGSYDTMYGTSISGAIVGGSYVLSVDVLDQSLATYISNFVNGTAAGSVVSVQFGAPSTLAILDSVISRVDNGDPSRNTMETDLRLGGNDLVGVNKVDANVVNSTLGNFNDVQSDTGTITSLSVDSITGNTGNLTTVNSTTVNTTNVTATGVANLGQVSASSVSATQVTGTNGVYDSGARVFSPVNLPTKNDVGLDRVQNYSITDSYTGNSSTLYASQKAVTQAYTKLNNEKLDKNAKAVDADKLDGIESSSFIRSDVNDYVNANTQWQDGRRVRFGSGADSEAFYDGSNFYLRNLNNGNIYIDNRRNNGDVVLRADNASGSTLDAVRVVGSDNVSVRLSQGGTERLRTTSFGVNVNGQIEADRVTVNGADVWTSSNDGSGSGLSADNLDGFNSSQFIRSDANQNVTANTEWQDNNEIRLGASADMRMVHNGSDSYITNYTGSFFVQNAANGGELVFRGRDSSGTIQEAIRVTTGTDEVAAVLSQNGNNKLRTRSYGAEVFGRLEADQITVNGSNVWTAASDGSGSGLSADNIDGIDSTQFLRVDTFDSVNATSQWQDGHEVRFGNSGDMRLGHDGSSTSYIRNNTGNLVLENYSPGGDVVFRAENNGGTLREAIRIVTGPNVATRILFDGVNKLETRSYGAEVFGRLEADQLTVNGSNVWTAANDGSGSGLSADNLDGINSSQFLRVDQDDNIAANTEWQDNYSARFGNSADLRILHTGSTSHISNYTGELITENRAHGGDMVFRSENTGGTLREAMRVVADGNVFVRLAYDSSERLKTTSYGVEVTGRVEADQLTVNGSNVWTAANDGSGSGLDADKFDGLNSTQFLRTDTNDVVNGHTEWQDNYSVRLGSSADMRMYHNGSHSYIDNYTNNLYLRNIKESAGILMEATAGNGNRYRGIAIHTDSNNVWGRLYSNGNARVDATRDGATIYGDVTVTGGDIYLAGKRLQNNSGNLYWDGKQVATLNGGGWSSSENRVAYTGTDGVMEVGRIVDFHATANSSRDYDMRFWASADELVLWGGDMTVRDGGMNISGDYKVNGRKIDKAYIGLDRVMNFSITNSYTGNSSSLYASQQAVTQAYNKLNNDKLDKNAKAADADKLDGIDSSLFVRTSRKINGKSLTSDITLSKSDIGLSKVDNFDSTNSYTGRATNLFVTQRALNDAYKDAISKLSPDRTYTQLFFRSGGLDKGTIFLERSWKGFEEIVVFAGPDNQNDLFVTRFTEKEYQLAEASWSYFGRPATEFKFHIISHHNNFWSGNFYSDVAFMTADENARIYAIYGVGR